VTLIFNYTLNFSRAYALSLDNNNACSRPSINSTTKNFHITWISLVGIQESLRQEE